MTTATANANNKKKTAAWVGWSICILAAIYYCFCYILRMYPSVMVQQLREHFVISATVFGSLSAFYYYAYTPMQLAVGVIVDRFGARAILTMAALFSTLGVFVFIISKNIFVADAARFIMGFGAAFGYVTVLKLATVWLPPNRFALMAGLTTSLGMIAASVTDLVLAPMVERIGFLHVLEIFLVIGIALVVLVFSLIRNRPKNDTRVITEGEGAKTTFSELVKSMGKMLLMPQMWLVGIVGLLLYLPASVFLDTWGLPYLEHVHALSNADAAKVISVVFWGWIVSSPLLGALSDRIARRKLPLLICSLGTTIVVLITFYAPNLNMTELYILFFLLGVFCGVHPLVFAIARENNINRYAGTAVAVTNTLIMLGGFFQPVVGLLLDWHWSGKMIKGVRAYSPADYTFALVIIPIALVLVSVMVCFIKETYCRIVEA